METEKNKHSKIGASSMYRWSACPGSVRMSEGIESPKSSYADEGTRAHELAADWLCDKPVDIEDGEMYQAVKTYVEVVLKDANNNEWGVEQKFDLSSIHPGLYGTADAFVYDSDNKLLKVYDFKYGQGILVEVENNSQLMYYGLGAMLFSDFICEQVELVIVQPRATHMDGPVRRWRFDAFDLLEFAADLKQFAEKTEDPNAPIIAGDHCRFCPAAGICPELSKKALDVAQTEFSPVLSYDPAKLSETLNKLEMLEGYAKSVRAFAYSEAEHGRCPPGWKLVEKRATRKWRDEDEVVEAFTDKYNLWDSKLKSPAQIEKIIPKELRGLVDELSISISSGLTLVPDSDKRQKALSSPEKDFEKIEND